VRHGRILLLLLLHHSCGGSFIARCAQLVVALLPGMRPSCDTAICWLSFELISHNNTTLVQGKK
jgi:hypothetical protein